MLHLYTVSIQNKSGQCVTVYLHQRTCPRMSRNEILLCNLTAISTFLFDFTDYEEKTDNKSKQIKKKPFYFFAYTYYQLTKSKCSLEFYQDKSWLKAVNPRHFIVLSLYSYSYSYEILHFMQLVPYIPLNVRERWYLTTLCIRSKWKFAPFHFSNRWILSAFLFCISDFRKLKSILLLKAVQSWDQTRLLRTLFSLVFKFSKVHLYCLVKQVIYR